MGWGDLTAAMAAQAGEPGLDALRDRLDQIYPGRREFALVRFRVAAETGRAV